MISQYLRLTLFVCTVLLGVQVPGLVDLYQQRLSAHLLEARQALQGFQLTADRHFEGELPALIRHYRESSDPVFRRDGDTIAEMVLRVQQLTMEKASMAKGPLASAWHLVSGADPDLRAATLNNYSYRVILSPLAIAWGLGIALLLSLIVEGGGRTCLWCARSLRRSGPKAT
ncbi:DUF2937 family protein [Ferrimonas gelatinilytica]|uniref:DUF2937 family protein n=1 Tax=Ferrimonas gelatinilytica TaxID=1255257 RepID=A0ABP9S622_9GAMM